MTARPRHVSAGLTMREYVDAIQGEGAWDQMHDLIERRQLLGWKLPPVTVDGTTVNIFPGSNREVTLQQVQDEIRKGLKCAVEEQ